MNNKTEVSKAWFPIDEYTVLDYYGAVNENGNRYAIVETGNKGKAELKVDPEHGIYFEWESDIVYMKDLIWDWKCKF